MDIWSQKVNDKVLLMPQLNIECILANQEMDPKLAVKFYRRRIPSRLLGLMNHSTTIDVVILMMQLCSIMLSHFIIFYTIMKHIFGVLFVFTKANFTLIAWVCTECELVHHRFRSHGRRSSCNFGTERWLL